MLLRQGTGGHTVRQVELVRRDMIPCAGLCWALEVLEQCRSSAAALSLVLILHFKGRVKS